MEKKKVIRIKAGEVVAMKYTGEDRPCNVAIGLLLKPIKVENGSNASVYTIHSMNAETWELMPNGASYSTGMDVCLVKGKEKALYFEKLAAHVLGSN